MKTSKQQIPLNDKDKEIKVWINVREIESNFEMDESSHRHTYEELILIKSGRGTQIIDNHVVKIQKNTLYLISNGQVHNFLSGKNLKGYVIGFDSQFLKTFPPFGKHIVSKLLENLKKYNSLSLDNEVTEELTKIACQMQKEYSKPENTFGKHDVLNSYLMVLLTFVERHIGSSRSLNHWTLVDHKYTVYQSFLDLIDTHFTDHHDLGFYAYKLGVSSRSLTSYSNLYAGFTAKQLIIRRVIMEAKRLLNFTTKSLSVISSELGFNDPSYFIRQFKHKTDLTPHLYRKNNTKLNQNSPK